MKSQSKYRRDLIGRMFEEIQTLKADDYFKYRKVIKGHLTFIKQLMS